MKDNYKMISLLGEGATSKVYLVEDDRNHEKYAMKCSEEHVLLEREANMLKGLHSPAFPSFREFGQEDVSYLVMEYIEGNNLQELLDRGRRFSKEEIVYIMDGILKALQYLHIQEEKLVYRDLKPSNIMIDKKGKVRLVDLGACYSKSGQETVKDTCTQRAGTYGYAAPEQFWTGIVPDKSCDIYAAGKILAYLLSGKNPAEPPYDMEQYCKGLKKVPAAFMEVIERSLSAECLARYEDCEVMRRAIHEAFEETMTKKGFRICKKKDHTYKKCIWKSEYRRIF